MQFQPIDFAACWIIALACSGISLSFTQGSLFEPVRDWAMRQHSLLGGLAKCFFCFSHWVAFAGVAIYQPRPLMSWFWVDMILSSFVIVAMSSLISGVTFAGFFAAGHAIAFRERMQQAAAATSTQSAVERK